MRFKTYLIESEQKIELIKKRQGTAILKVAYKDRSMVRSMLDSTKDLDYVMSILKSMDYKNKYLQWIVNRFIKGEIQLEDVGIISNLLEEFHTNKNKLDKKDINQYTRNNLFTALSAVTNKKSNREQDKEFEDEMKKNNEFEIYYQDSSLKIVIPKSIRASQYFGRGTRWCTAATKNCAFENYKGSPLYIIMPKGGEKLQLHFSSGQFMDSSDVEINFAKLKFLNKLKKIFEQQAKKYFILDLLDKDKIATKELEDRFLNTSNVKQNNLKIMDMLIERGKLTDNTIDKILTTFKYFNTFIYFFSTTNNHKEILLKYLIRNPKIFGTDIFKKFSSQAMNIAHIYVNDILAELCEKNSILLNYFPLLLIIEMYNMREDILNDKDIDLIVKKVNDIYKTTNDRTLLRIEGFLNNYKKKLKLSNKSKIDNLLNDIKNKKA